MLTLKPRQRAVLLEKVPDLANLGAGALIFGQFVSDQPFSAWLALAGFGVWGGLMAGTLFIAGDVR
jgi:hypothetical protein